MYRGSWSTRARTRCDDAGVSARPTDGRTDGRTEDRTGERGDDGVSDDDDVSDARGAGGCRSRRSSATTIRNSNAKG